MSRLATLFTCLLALLVASPLCCCAGEIAKTEAASSCCCCGDGTQKESSSDKSCLCSTDDPREMPDVALPHPSTGVALALQPGCVWLPVAVETGESLRPRWQPSIPWHAPPGERRALLVSRIL